VEVLKAYSHTPARLHDLQKAVEIVRRQEPNDGPNDGCNEAVSRPASGLWQTDWPRTRCRRSSSSTGEALSVRI
jgi:hypothetical protein